VPLHQAADVDAADPLRAVTLHALQVQRRELDQQLRRLERARRDLVPPAPDSWRGAARYAYDAAYSAVVQQLEAGAGALRSARQRTDSAILWLSHG